MGQPPGGGWGQPPGYDPNQGYPQQQQQGYPQQQQGYPQQQQQGYPSQPGAQPPVAPKKKKSPVGCIVAALLLPILGFGGFLFYQHFFNWGYVRAPDEVKAHVDPHIEELQKIAEKAAAYCSGTKEDLDNPLEGAKVLKSKGFRAARVQCRRGFSEPTHPFKKLDDVSEEFTVSIHNQDGFKCMAPNWLGVDSEHKSTDCVMWKGSGSDPVVVYYVERTGVGTMKSEIRVEWGPEEKKKSKKKSDDDD
jgi:hypothetical protein